MSEAGERVSEYWSRERKGPRYISWLEHPVLIQHVHRRVTGDAGISTYTWFVREYVPHKVSRVLMLGCGLGALDRSLYRMGIAERYDACDISEGAIQKASQQAHEEGLKGLHYSVVDLNNLDLEPATYDVILAVSSAHHVFQLEKMFATCRAALKPDGIMFLDEYIGPSRFNSTETARRIIDNLLREIPARYRVNHLTSDGALYDRYTPPPVEHWEATDPSEAIRSAEIVPVLKMYFDVIEYRPYGGAILHMLLSGITGNFDPDSEIDNALLRTIALFEEELELAGAINSDFAAIVAKTKPPFAG